MRMLTLIYEYSRECLSIDVARSLTSEDVLERLMMLFITSGPAVCPITSDPTTVVSSRLTPSATG